MKFSKKVAHQWSFIFLMAVTGLSFSSAASAVIISSEGQSFSVFFGGNVEGTDYSGLTGQADFSLTQINGTDWIFDVDLFNTTDNTFDESRISVLGFAVNPNITGGSATNTNTDENGDPIAGFDSVALNSIKANGGIATEICVKDGGGTENCNGGGGTGVGIGEQFNFTLTLSFSSDTLTEIDLTDFGIRWQSLNSTYHSISDGSGTGVPVPAPLALGLIGFGLLGIGFARKFRKA